jgi:hypothetical protein
LWYLGDRTTGRRDTFFLRGEENTIPSRGQALKCVTYMPWKNSDRYPFKQDQILWIAQKSSGVYGLYSSKNCVFIGESPCIQETLEGHFAGDIPCITQNNPTTFIFEVLSEKYRKARRDELIAEFNPLCR